MLLFTLFVVTLCVIWQYYLLYKAERYVQSQFDKVKVDIFSHNSEIESLRHELRLKNVETNLVGTIKSLEDFTLQFSKLDALTFPGSGSLNSHDEVEISLKYEFLKYLVFRSFSDSSDRLYSFTGATSQLSQMVNEMSGADVQKEFPNVFLLSDDERYELIKSL